MNRQYKQQTAQPQATSRNAEPFSFDRITVPLVPRNTMRCLDIAMKFFAQNLSQFKETLLSVALPSGLLAYLLTTSFDMDFRLTLVVIYFAIIPLGVLLTANAASAIFGDQLFRSQHSSSQQEATSEKSASLWVVDLIAGILLVVLVVSYFAELFAADLLPTDSLHIIVAGLLTTVLCLRLLLLILHQLNFCKELGSALTTTIYQRLGMAIGPAMMLFFENGFLILLGLLLCGFSLFLYIRFSFRPESAFLSTVDQQLHGRNIKELLKSRGSDLVVQKLGIFAVCALLMPMLFFSIDIGCDLLFGFPILLGRLSDVVSETGKSPHALGPVGETLDFMAGDPRALVLLTTVALIVYSINRLAWLFSYIDLRVRYDLWDIELQFQQEAQRLQKATGQGQR